LHAKDAQTMFGAPLYKKVGTHGLNLLEKEEVQSRLARVGERLENNKQKLKTLNWEKNPEIKRTAERLGIFEEKPTTGPIKSTQNYLEKRYLERVKKLRKGVEKVVEADGDIIDGDFVNQDRSINIPRIRIKN